MNWIEKIQKELPLIRFEQDADFLEKYARDASENLYFPPTLLALPKNTQEVSQLIVFCHHHGIPVFPRGAGTGLVGGSLADREGLMVSLEKMNQIKEIDSQNFTATVEAGVINYDLQMALAPFDLFFPPDPSSWQSSFIGGNIATNAGGPRAVKYGVTAKWILNLEVVLADGSIIWTGANTFKNVTAYSFTSLFIGSEGTLGIITQAVLQLAIKPKYEQSMLVSFHHLKESAKAISKIFQAGLEPSTLELMDKSVLQEIQKYEPEAVPFFPSNTAAQLLISYDGNEENQIFQQLEKTYTLLSEFSIEEPFIAQTKSEQDRIWKTRRNMAEILRTHGFTIEEDTVVPRAQLPNLISFAHQLGQKYGVEMVCYGHAGDGNLHIRIRHPKYAYSYQNTEIEPIIEELFKKVVALGGTITAEHGIGLIQKKYISIALPEANIKAQKAIKTALDPKDILNPGKVF